MNTEETFIGLQSLIRYALVGASQGRPEAHEWVYPQLILAAVQHTMARQRPLRDPHLDPVGDYTVPVYETLLAIAEELGNTDQAVLSAWERWHEENLDPQNPLQGERERESQAGALREARRNAEAARLLMHQAIGCYARVVQTTSKWRDNPYPYGSLTPFPADKGKVDVQAELYVDIDGRSCTWKLHPKEGQV